MSQHDLDIANQGFPATRADLNNALKALGSTNSGATAPSTTYANQLWYDTANNILKIRNEDNDAFISLFTLDQANDDIESLGVGTSSPQASVHAVTTDFKALQLEGPRPTAFFKETDGSADENFQLRLNGGELLISKQNDAQSSATDVLTLKQSGDVEIDDGNLVLASGHGIDFSGTANSGNSASMSNELFSDYEEGTWTPTASASSGSAGSFTVVNAHYTKIGRMVHVRAELNNINTSGTTGTATFRIAGFPFTIDTCGAFGVVVFDQVTLQGSRTQMNISFSTSETASFPQSGGTGSEQNMKHNDMNSGTTDVFLQGVYFSDQ
jgi:hypothetical protein